MVSNFTKSYQIVAELQLGYVRPDATVNNPNNHWSTYNPDVRKKFGTII